MDEQVGKKWVTFHGSEFVHSYDDGAGVFFSTKKPGHRTKLLPERRARNLIDGHNEGIFALATEEEIAAAKALQTGPATKAEDAPPVDKAVHEPPKKRGQGGAK